MERGLALMSESVEKYVTEIEDILKRRGIDIHQEGGGDPPAGDEP